MTCFGCFFILWLTWLILGVLGFYYAQLTPVIQYGELRTEVFQVFKEIGNTVLFCLLLEKAMVRLVVMF